LEIVGGKETRILEFMTALNPPFFAWFAMAFVVKRAKMNANT
jgi:hypothetical protein